MTVGKFYCVAPEVEDARIMPVIDGHSFPGTSPPRKPWRNERPSSIPTIDRPLSAEIKEKLKTKLKERYHGLRRYSHARDTRLDWYSSSGYTVGMFVLDKLVPTLEFDFHRARQWCNISTALYWAPTAQRTDGEPCSALPFRCIYKTWFDYHDGSPDIEFETFLAKPIRLTSNGPRTISEIIQAHRSFCDQVLGYLMEHARTGEAGEERPRGFANYDLLLSFRALVVILVMRRSRKQRKKGTTMSSRSTMRWRRYSSRTEKNSLVTKSFESALGVNQNTLSNLLDPDQIREPYLSSNYKDSEFHG